MTTHNIFTKLANRMVGAMMTHTQLTELFTFIDLMPDAKRQKKQFHEESDGLFELEKYAVQHHNLLITSSNPPQVDILNLGMLKQPNDELSPDNKIYLMMICLWQEAVVVADQTVVDVLTLVAALMSVDVAIAEAMAAWSPVMISWIDSRNLWTKLLMRQLARNLRSS
jgi:hypothetical protein